ncbi:M1 family metallopeptidase [Sinomicrobium soli]|uniref:M1 family metallopeptidase n=1 Tax=Sinomicrobium sp. N-1-3-6 TaxID=2219864 RepID=UPI000DCF5057|nr:M1 family metallopeptidase [Sinomicrobium sp. N-1-3-6]RAV28088.1 M1 family peptidase [Sinomicrobium sp. N-1-3-6]
MFRNIMLGSLAVLYAITLHAQELYIPRDVKKAYENNTRSKDGNPGANYWQNKGVYTIDLTVSPPDRNVTGKETIVYTNHSPDTLKALNFKLFLNQHKPEAPRSGQTSPDYLTSGMHIDTYSENGVAREWTDKNDGTNKMVTLADPLAPGASVTLDIGWHFDLSVQSGREGAIDETTFFLAYFFPRVAVYDDSRGWDTMSFRGSQEFYNDFNDYTFSVTVPANYIVWATGDLQNPDEVLQPRYAQLLEESMTSDEVIHIATKEDLEGQKVTRQNPENTWKWKADNITDIAIALSDHYLWDAGSVVADPETGRRASVQAAYDEPSEDFREMVGYGKHAIDWFSNNYPGVPYPFSKSTIVRGFADMEYPMMVNDSSFPEAEFARFVVEHEIAHTYFPFYMGINETRFGFMDEGWATTLEYLIGIHDLGKEKATENFKKFRVASWANNADMEYDLPVITPLNVLNGPPIRANAYGKAAIGYLAVKEYLGDALFGKALKGYMDRWNGKHPMPWDFFYSFNDLTGKDLNWFWDRWYFSNNYIDIAITDASYKKNALTISLENIGGMPAPVTIVVTGKDGKTQEFHQTPAIWEADPEHAQITLKNIRDVAKISLDGGIFMDADTSNDSFTIR